MTWLTKRRAPWVALAAGVLLAALAGWHFGRSLQFDVPDVAALEDYAPPVTTRLYAAEGGMLQSFAEQRRVMIRNEDIPDLFRQALLATEDTRFYDHPGLDPRGIVRVVWTNFTRGTRHGASTLTQQLARSLFLNLDKTWKRKFQEALLTLELERLYTKEEIFGFYCNQIYMGHGRYGIEAAANHYFGKAAADVDLPEAALLAGLIQRPESISPFKNPERALKRREHVLDRMVAVGFIDAETARLAKQAPLPSRDRPADGPAAPYFVEQVRRWLKDKWGDDALYREGLSVRTTLEPDLQGWANAAVAAGLRELDKRQGWRGAQRTLAPDEIESFASETWAGAWTPGRIVEAVVLEADPEAASLKLGERSVVLPRKGFAWTKKRRADRLFEPGQVILVELVETPEDGDWTVRLEQEPRVEGALIAIEPSTGEIKALVGGFDFDRSEFDRAVQARRQTGSAFKPFVYAAALAHDWTLADTIVDEATVFIDPALPDPYIPKNFTNRYYGTLTLRRSLEKSANVSTVKLLNAVGARRTIAVARRLGLEGDLRPYPSLALGAFESTLIELTGAYATFANQGVRVEPHFVREVRDGDGGTLYLADPEIHDALTPQVADLMNRVLSGVITDGTGASAAGLGRGIAGKTGTTDDSTDAWFIGYAPDLAVGVWVGFDKKNSLGEDETGAKAALPIWRAFMRPYLAAHPAGEFPRSSGIATVSIDRATGLRANPAAGCATSISEAFITGTEPAEFCSTAMHRKLLFPPRVQHYPLNPDGFIEIPDADLFALLREIPTLTMTDDGRSIAYRSATASVTLPVRLVPGSSAPPISPSLVERLDREDKGPSTWLGIHGGPARLEYFR